MLLIKTATNATFIVMTKAQAAFMQALNIVVALKNKNTTMLLRQKSPFALSLARCIVLVVIFLHCRNETACETKDKLSFSRQPPPNKSPPATTSQSGQHFPDQPVKNHTADKTEPPQAS